MSCRLLHASDEAGDDLRARKGDYSPSKPSSEPEVAEVVLERIAVCEETREGSDVVEMDRELPRGEEQEIVVERRPGGESASTTFPRAPNS